MVASLLLLNLPSWASPIISSQASGALSLVQQVERPRPLTSVSAICTNVCRTQELAPLIWPQPFRTPCTSSRNEPHPRELIHPSKSLNQSRQRPCRRCWQGGKGCWQDGRRCWRDGRGCWQDGRGCCQRCNRTVSSFNWSRWRSSSW